MGVLDDDVIDRARALTADVALCNHCLGRYFMEVSGKTNEERGRKIRRALKEREPKKCDVCGGFFRKLPEISGTIARELLVFDATRIVVSCHVPEEVLGAEERIWQKYGIKQSESIKKDIKQTVGRLLREIGGWKYDPKSADVRIIIEWDTAVQVVPEPIYITAEVRPAGLSKADVQKIVESAAEHIFGAKRTKLRVKCWKSITPAVIVVQGARMLRRPPQLLETLVNEIAGHTLVRNCHRTTAEGANKFLEGER